MKVKIVNKSEHQLPCYETSLSAGMDIRANLVEEHVFKLLNIETGYNEKGLFIISQPGQRVPIPTGLFISLPKGFEAQLRPRSGLALNYGISLVNTPGTIDADYRGEIGVIVINHGNKPFVINNGDRICQMVIKQFEQVEWVECESLDETDRGSGGFGHSGRN